MRPQKLLQSALWGVEIRTYWLSVESYLGVWKSYLAPRRATGAGHSYLGGLLEPRGGKSFLGEWRFCGVGKFFVGARESYLKGSVA